MDKWTTVSWVSSSANRGHCHLCGQEFLEGWLDEMANETCNDCKVAIDGLDDQELLEELESDNLTSILNQLGFPIFEIREGWFDA